MPLRSREEFEQPKLQGVNLVANPIKLGLGTFALLQNWIPAKRYKLKKKRGVATLVGTGFAPVVSPHNCGETATKSLSMECGHDCPLGQFSQADFIFDAGSVEIGGPAIRIASASTDSSFTGLGVVYDRSNTKLVLSRWAAQSLDDVGTIINTYVVALVGGETIRLEADDTDPFTYRVKVDGGTVITWTDSGHIIDVHNPCVGFIELAAITYP